MNGQILAIQRMQEYIEAHLEPEITLSHLVKVSLFSPWHSYRLFRQHTGLIGYPWNDSNSRIQLEPRGERGDIELRAVRPL